MYLTRTELRSIIDFIDTLEQLGYQTITPGRVPMFDQNGEKVGYLSNDSGEYAFYPEGDDD